MNRVLYIRADANAAIGAGHVMRCIALGQEWKSAVGGPVTFLGRIDSPALQERIHREGFSLIGVPAVHPDIRDAAFVIEALERACQDDADDAPHWLVLDGYRFDATYQERLSGGKHRVLVIDDNGLLPEYHCHILLNQNIYAEQLSYHGAAGMARLLGPRYALLRTEFRQTGGLRSVVPPVARNILVTLGGADPRNVTATILSCLAELHIPDLRVKALIGTENPHEASLSALVDGMPMQCALIPAANDMAGLMQWADVAVAAAGTTVYELAAMGVPFLTLAIAENQEANASSFAQKGIAINLGQSEELTPARVAAQMRDLLHDVRQRKAQSQAGQALVDGRGAERVVAAMRGAVFSFRRAQWADRDVLLEWANDPQARKNSFNSRIILREEHEKWLAAKLESPDCHMVVAIDHKGAPVGVVRFDIGEGKAVISVNLAAQSRGKGLGSRIIATACDGLFAERPVSVVEALIKEDNVASLRAFQKAGFGAAEKKMQGDIPAVCLYRYRSHGERD